MKITCMFLLMLLVLPLAAQDGDVVFFDTDYDVKVDPFDQLTEAKALARDGNKLILLDVGGEWCIWCHRLDDFFRGNKDISDYLIEHYVPVKINFSLENKNEEFLRQYPKAAGYPHIYVLDRDGLLVHSQNTGDLEEGKGHSREKVMAFLKKWAESKE